jgi:hypothetical protein
MWFHVKWDPCHPSLAPPRGPPRATIVVGEALFLFKNPVDDSSNADTALAGSGQEPLEWRGQLRESVDPLAKPYKSWRL